MMNGAGMARTATRAINVPPQPQPRVKNICGVQMGSKQASTERDYHQQGHMLTYRSGSGNCGGGVREECVDYKVLDCRKCQHETVACYDMSNLRGNPVNLCLCCPAKDEETYWHDDHPNGCENELELLAELYLTYAILWPSFIAIPFAQVTVYPVLLCCCCSRCTPEADRHAGI